MPDYKGVSPEEAVRDFQSRIEQYERVYETMADKSLSWIKFITNPDSGRGISVNRIRGYVPGRILHFVNSLHTAKRHIYLSRHGQSEYNTLGKIGGDSGLSPLGEAYALRLAKFAKLEILAGHPHARLWTSSLKRTIQTGRHIEHTTLPDGWVTMRPKVWRAMDELCELLCVCVQNLNLNEQQLRILSLFLSPHPSPRHCNDDACRVQSSLILQMLACSTE
jgi:hypothetical protein